MGLFSFITSAGEKLAGGPDDKAGEQQWRQAALKNVPAKLGLPVTDFGVVLEGELAVLTGKAASQEVREKIVLAIGNTAGVGKVDDRLEVAGPAAAAQGGAGKSAAPAAEAAVFYTVKEGDNLSKIAKQHYGDASKYQRIFEANKPMLKDPDKIYVGQTLRIPPKA